jgi:Sodium:sulfate symporter transmembrane region
VLSFTFSQCLLETTNTLNYFQIGPANGQSPMVVLTPVVLCISLALCFPSGTPPNAIILTNKNVTLAQMAIVGLSCTVIYLVIIFTYCYFVFPLLYDITFIPQSVYTACDIDNNVKY